MTKPAWRRSGPRTTRNSRSCYAEWSIWPFKKPIGSLARYRDPDLRNVGHGGGFDELSVHGPPPEPGHRTPRRRSLVNSVPEQLRDHSVDVLRSRRGQEVRPPTALGVAPQGGEVLKAVTRPVHRDGQVRDETRAFPK